MEYDVIIESPAYSSFINVDFEQEKITIAPRLEDKAGLYD